MLNAPFPVSRPTIFAILHLTIFVRLPIRFSSACPATPLFTPPLKVARRKPAKKKNWPLETLRTQTHSTPQLLPHPFSLTRSCVSPSSTATSPSCSPPPATSMPSPYSTPPCTWPARWRLPRSTRSVVISLIPTQKYAVPRLLLPRHSGPPHGLQMFYPARCASCFGDCGKGCLEGVSVFLRRRRAWGITRDPCSGARMWRWMMPVRPTRCFELTKWNSQNSSNLIP